MNKFIPREKLSKKARKELNSRERLTWDINPFTRRKESKKVYERKKAQMRYDDYPTEPLSLYVFI